MNAICTRVAHKPVTLDIWKEKSTDNLAFPTAKTSVIPKGKLPNILGWLFYILKKKRWEYFTKFHEKTPWVNSFHYGNE